MQDLEREVKYLREQLEISKQKLKSYELVDKHSNGLGKDMCNILAESYKEMYELNQPLNNYAAFIETLQKRMLKYFEELKYVLTQLTKTMMRIILPSPLRVSM